MAVYRTAAVGTVHLLDLFRDLHEAKVLPRAIRQRFVPIDAEHDERLPMAGVIPAAPCTPDDALSVAEYLRERVGRAGATRVRRARTPQPLDTEQAALAAITALAARLAEMDALRPLPALVQWADRTSYSHSPFTAAAPGAPLPWLSTDTSTEGALLRLSWLVVAMSHASPPLVLFTRSPSLRFWRPDGALSVRWLRSLEPRA
jgi:hypothetical protein